MTPSERERRIEAATKVLYGHRVHSAGVSCAALAREALDAAEEAAPTVSQWVKDEQQRILDRQFWDMRVALTERAERAEAAARDVAREAFRGGYERGVSSGTLAPRDFSGLEHHWQTWCYESGYSSFSGEAEADA